MITPSWRIRLFGTAAAMLAVWMGFAVANGSFLWPVTIATLLGLFLLARWQPLPLGTVLLGAAVAGYVVGSRGFAQLLLTPHFPLLPAEAVLLAAGAMLLVQAAWRHELPFRRDPLNVLLLAWIVYGLARVPFDVRTFGFMALRDFATVYYALFFFLAQDAARNLTEGRALLATLRASSAVSLIVFLAYERYPGFFLGSLTFRGVPLIFYKGDLVGTFFAVGSVLFFLRFEERRHGWGSIAASLALAAGVLATDNRASLLGLVVAAVWLALGRRWRFGATLAGSGAAAALAILATTTVMNTSWEKTPLFGLYERVISIVDPSGQRVYRAPESFNKGDNNLFRAVWWRAVADETIQEGPYLGLGFGRDLADRFVREYYPESSEEFSVRSPHNVLLTIFARMGAVGLALFLAVIGVMAVRTWRAVRAGPREAAPWCAAWVILTSACFGVVLEGPMGAVVFWTVLGVASATSRSEIPAAVAVADGSVVTSEPTPVAEIPRIGKPPSQRV